MVGGSRSASLALFYTFGTCRSNGKLQMHRDRVAVISIGTMVSFELILFHGTLYFGQKKIFGQKYFR